MSSQAPDEGQAPARRKRFSLLRLLLWLVAAAIGVAAVITGWHYLDEYTEGDEFCGTLCHPNRPEYEAHRVSDHASVDCGTCHIGPGLLPKFLAKIYGTGELYSLVTNTYERPIEPPVSRLRPASEICEQCHWADRSYPDRVRVTSSFAADEQNSETLTYLVLRTGGGETSQVSRNVNPWSGIHWHVENPVWYVATDVERQEIPWAAVEENGQLVEYMSRGSSLSAARLQELERRQMDCMDCHNRATHDFRNPEQLLDEALATGRLDRTLPYIKWATTAFTTASYPTQESGLEGIAGLADWYRANYPGLTGAQQAAVAQAVEVAQTIYAQNVFPYMNLDWRSYPNNIGHTDFPGCFRCHDGEHLNDAGEAIATGCTTCHSVPAVVGPSQDKLAGQSLLAFVAKSEQPESHRQASFTQDHRILANDSCAACHGPVAYGTDNSSFCANSACHAQEWPGKEARAPFIHPVTLEGRHAEATCNACHQGVPKPVIQECATCHEPPSQPHFGSACSECHTPVGWRASAAKWVTDVPVAPHLAPGGLDCSQCHGAGSPLAAPADHAGIPGETCTTCHVVKLGTEQPEIPHTVVGIDRCLSCHVADKAVPPPADHEGWGNESCLLCHQSEE